MNRSPLPSQRSCATTDWRAAINRLEGAYSDNTLRSYRADFALFENWCETEQLPALPASPETVARFIAARAPRDASATLRRRLCSIRKLHRLHHFENPGESEEALIAMRRALRSKPRRQKQALGLSKLLREKLVAACPDTLAGLRDRALLAVGYDTLCRRSELVSLRVEDVTMLDDGAASILIRRAKNDPFGDGRYGYLSPATLVALRAWLEAARIDSGWLFRRVRGSTVGANPLHPYSVNRILKIAAAAAGLDSAIVQNLSGHSMRVGAAQDLMINGAGVLPIMRAGGWKSMNVIGRYVEHANMVLDGRMR